MFLTLKNGMKMIGNYLSELQMQILSNLVNASYTPKALAVRAKIILFLAEGKSIPTISSELKISLPTVYKWEKRWLKARETLDQIEKEKPKHELKKSIENTLRDAQRSGAPPTFTPEQVLKIIALACTSPEAEQIPVSHWSCRLLAEHAVKKGIVDSISYKQINIFLKSGPNKTPQN